MGKIYVEAREVVGAAKCGQEGESGRAWVGNNQVGSTLLSSKNTSRSGEPQPKILSDNFDFESAILYLQIYI